MNRRYGWMWVMAAASLLYLPLRAQEAPPQPEPQQEAGDAAEDEVSEAEPAEEETQPEEHVSADNNLSFPVDI